MPKEKLVSVIVHTPFKLTLSTGAVVEYTKGHHNMPEEHAGHWFTQAHAELSDHPADADNDELNQLKTLLAQRDEQLLERQQAIDSLNQQIEDLNAQLATSLIGGEGETNGKKSGPANCK
jgi:hypothetical protein